MDKDKLKKLISIIKESKNIVFFGGAGVSTESGLKDYRSEDGIYNTVHQYGYSPETILSIDFFRKNPEMFYSFYRDYFISDAKPNSAHFALAQLEKQGKLSAVVTQNVDCLHQEAGSRNVLELHGSVAKYYCTNCKKIYTLSDVVNSSSNVPHCSNCNGIIKPVVTLYGEMLDDSVVSKAIKAISEADTLIIGGTSLAVYPAASFVGYFRGSNIVIINKSETFYENRATLVFHDSIGSILTAVMDEMN